MKKKVRYDCVVQAGLGVVRLVLCLKGHLEKDWSLSWRVMAEIGQGPC